jgi:molybdenum cofactor biosynthesis enzyme MoaA
MDCFFCHNEGMDNPRRPGPTSALAPAGAEAVSAKKDPLKRKGPSLLSAEHLLNIMNAFTHLGGKQINVTGAL